MPDHSSTSSSNLKFLQGGGDMGALIRSIDWSANGLGAPELWPPALRQTVSMMLTNRFPILICWGTKYIQLYNDAFRPINGDTKHPQAMGGSARDTYAEIWDTIGPMFQQVMDGENLGFPDFMVPLDRNGYIEECYFDFSYSPIYQDDGTVGGVLVICMETTSRVKAIAETAAVADELAASNEELTAAIEEYTAINEELASVNDELATTNEQLARIKDELEQSLKETARGEKLFRSIVLNIPRSLIIVIDREHRYVTIEGDIMERMGFDRSDYEGKHPKEVGPPERYEASKHLYDKVLAGEQFSVERKSETGEDFMVHFVPLKNEEGDVEAGLIIALDISEIKQAEEKSAKLAAIIDSSDDAIIGKTLDGIITSWNEAAERIFGFTAAEMIGETMYKIIPEDRVDEEPAILLRLSNGERVDHFETKRVTKHGELLDISVTVSPVRNKAGQIIGASKIARDITEKKLDESRKNDFIGMASHELKTPLTSLNAIVQLAGLKLKNSNDPFLASAMEKANTQVKRMTNMINGFLNVSRLESGKIHIDKQKFNLGVLLHEMTDEAILIARGHDIVLNCKETITVDADRDKIASVLTNLITNAVKYSPKGKLITIACQDTADTVTVSVKDEGIGIKPADRENLFERYYRVQSKHTEHIAGFGIGLYLSAEIVHRHDGQIWVESESGVGSTFYFSLPLR